MNNTYIIKGISNSRDIENDCNYVLYSISDENGWTEMEVAIWVDDYSDYWTPATMNRSNHMWELVNGDVEKFHDIITRIAGGASTELHIEQNNAII